MKGHMKFTNLSKDIERAILDQYESKSLQDKSMNKMKTVRLLKQMAKHCINMTE